MTMTEPALAFHGGLPLSFDDTIVDALRLHPAVYYNLSGGKDSGATAFAVNAHLDAIGHPRSRRFAIHADLGRIEWGATPSVVEATAAFLGVPLIVVRRAAGDLVHRWETRFSNALTRYGGLDTYRLIGPWSSSTQRFCTAEMKAQVIGPAISKRHRGETVIQVLGIRREESTGRAKTPISARDNRHAPVGNSFGTTMLLWNPAVSATKDQVFTAHAAHGIPLHESYTVYRASRLSCSFCILAAADDLRAAARCPGNHGVFRHLVEMEARSTFSFQPSRWLADAAPELLSPSLADLVASGKSGAAERRASETRLPAGIGDAKAWPARIPSAAEAAVIAAVRSPILARHSVEDAFPDGPAVQARLADLLERRLAKAA